MARTRIFQQPRNNTQSGYAGTQDWMLEFEPAEQRRADPLMGWIGSGDTEQQVRLRFDTQADAVAFAQSRGLTFAIELPHVRRVKPKAYADNFKFGRIENWTH